jgi:integrase
VLVEPKSQAGKRTIALPRQLGTALAAHRRAQLQEQIAAGASWQANGLVFASETGAPIDPHRDWKDWRTLCETAGVRIVRLHDARHTAATLLLTQGVPARVAMQILGHSQISLTLGTYSHVVPELARDAADRIGEALWGTTGVPPDIGYQGGTGQPGQDVDAGSPVPDNVRPIRGWGGSGSNRRPRDYESLALTS